MRTRCRQGVTWLHGRSGFGLGPVGPWVRRVTRWVLAGGLLVAALDLALWTYPTGGVVFRRAVAALGGVTVVEFLDQGDQLDKPPTGAADPPAG